MKPINETVFKCKTEKELTTRRNKLKKYAKDEGVFLKAEGNTIYTKNGYAYTFVVEDVPADVEECLPPEAFSETARKAARDMIE